MKRLEHPLKKNITFTFEIKYFDTFLKIEKFAITHKGQKEGATFLGGRGGSCTGAHYE